MYTLTDTEWDDCLVLADTMCEYDKYEMRCCGYSTMRAALLDSMNYSHKTYTWKRDGEVVGIGGVARYGTHGVIWLLSTGMRKHARALVEWTPKVMVELSDGLKTVGNYVPTFQRDHISWLVRQGFKATGKQRTLSGEVFVELTKEV